MSRFLRDYLYIPLGGSRRGEPRRYVNLLATMLLGGLWHGAGWTYVVWGAVHGLYLVVNHGWVNLRTRIPIMRRIAGTDAYALAALLLTQVCVVVAWVFFRADNFDVAARILNAMAGATPMASTASSGAVHLVLVVLAYVACISLPNVNELFQGWNLGFAVYDTARPWSALSIKWTPTYRWAVATAAVLLAAIFTSLIAGDRIQFLYFQF